MNEEIKEILNIYLIFEYYKNKNIFDRYKVLIDSGRLVIDNECLDILENPKVMLYLTTFKKYKKLKQENEKLNNDINKAIKYIEEIKNKRDGLSVTEYKSKWRSLLDYYESDKIINDLLDILKSEVKQNE